MTTTSGRASPSTATASPAIGLAGRLPRRLIDEEVGAPLMTKRATGTRGAGVMRLDRLADLEDLLLMVEGSLADSPMLA